MRSLLMLLTVTLCLGLLASPALAAEPAEAGGGVGDKLLKIEPVTVVLTILVFVLLLIVLSKTAWKPILGALKKREETIAKALDDAKAANERALEKIAEYESRIQNAKDEAQAIADEARKDAEDIKARIQQEAQQEADASVERAKREISQLTAKAWDTMVRDAAALSTEAASKIIGQGLDDTGHAQIVAGVVADFAAKRGQDA